MICSFDEGISLLKKWQQEDTPLQCVFHLKGVPVESIPWVVRGMCWVQEVSYRLRVRFSDAAAFDALITPNIRFNFETPADTAGLPAVDLTMYTSWLTVDLSIGVILMLAEKAPNA
jgi:hypothetical protein